MGEVEPPFVLDLLDCVADFTVLVEETLRDSCCFIALFGEKEEVRSMWSTFFFSYLIEESSMLFEKPWLLREAIWS